jgi:DNA-binding NarL/FixJ family response regulator
MADVRVLVVAGNLLSRTGLAALLASQPEIDIVGQTAGDDDTMLLDDLSLFRPDIVAYDMGYDPLAVLDQVATLAETQIPLLLLLPDTTYAADTLPALAEAGAYGLLLQNSDSAVLAGALTAVAGGLVIFDPEIVSAVLTTPAGIRDSDILLPPSDDLTPRELDVLYLLARGLPNKSIAQRLEISPNTVKFHVNAILSKLNAQSRTEAVVVATRLGLIAL